MSDTLVVENDVWLIPPTAEPRQLVPYYHTADIYVHAAHVETFGLTMVEAMAAEAAKRFDVNTTVNAYLAWYYEILEQEAIRAGAKIKG